MTKHTPGPWRFLEDGDTESEHNRCRPLTVCGPGDDDLANVYSRDDATVTISREEAIANARLIAAAPDLLEAAKILVGLESDDKGRTFPTKEQVALARAAVTKATK